MPRSTQKTPPPSRSGMAAAEPAEIQRLVEDLDGMLSRLRLGAIREQLDGLLEEAARRQLNLRETLAWLCAAEVASKELEFPRFRGQLSCHPKGYISTNLSAILECYWAVVTNRGMASLRIVVAINPEGQILQQLFGSTQES